MQPEFIIEFLILAIMIVFSAFFSSAETAITSITKAKVRDLKERGVPGSKVLMKLKEHPKKMLTTVLIGNNLFNTAAATMATAVAMRIFTYYGITSVALLAVIVTLLTTFVLIIFAEITPKTLALRNPEILAPLLAWPVYLIMKFIQPVVAFINLLTGWLINLLGGHLPEKGSLLTEEEIRTWVNLGDEEGVFEQDKGEMIEGVFELHELVVREVMTPRMDIKSIPKSSTINEARRYFGLYGHSRLPVIEGDLDNVAGIIFARDIVRISPEEFDHAINDIIHPIPFLPETQKLDEAFSHMKKSKTHLAIVVDEYGTTVGLVTLEDLLERIVGEINDEFDAKKGIEMERINKNTYLVEAKMNIQDFADQLEIELPQDSDYDSIGGFLTSLFGRIPRAGEQINYENMKFEILEIRRHRIVKIKVIIEEPLPKSTE